MFLYDKLHRRMNVKAFNAADLIVQACKAGGISLDEAIRLLNGLNRQKAAWSGISQVSAISPP
jgi:hypothetical protein